MDLIFMAEKLYNAIHLKQQATIRPGQVYKAQ